MHSLSHSEAVRPISGDSVGAYRALLRIGSNLSRALCRRCGAQPGPGGARAGRAVETVAASAPIDVALSSEFVRVALVPRIHPVVSVYIRGSAGMFSRSGRVCGPTVGPLLRTRSLDVLGAAVRIPLRALEISPCLSRQLRSVTPYGPAWPTTAPRLARRRRGWFCLSAGRGVRRSSGTLARGAAKALAVGRA